MTGCEISYGSKTVNAAKTRKAQAKSPLLFKSKKSHIVIPELVLCKDDNSDYEATSFLDLKWQ